MAYASFRLTRRGGRPSLVRARGFENALVLTAIFALAATSGCQGGGGGPLARWRAANDDSLSRPPTEEELGDSRGMFSRWFAPKVERTNIAEVLGLRPDNRPGAGLEPAAPDPAAQAEFEAAEALYQQGQLAQAEAAFGKIAKRRKDTIWGEKAQFYLAESLFQRGKYVAAHDAYEELLARYPGTRYLEKSVEREYAIAQDWMAALNTEAAPEKQPSLRDWWSGRHPAVDISGHALGVLEHVRHHDPLGPLADDAVLQIADHHFAAGNFDDASFYYDQLIEEHPKSEHIHRAYMQSIDSKLNAYVGPNYDGTGLEEARKLALQSMSMFPEQRASYSDELYHKLALIEDQMAERTYRRGERYLWTGKVTSAEYCFGEIPARWPESPWAEKAREQLTVIATLPRKETLPSRIMAQPGSTDPMTGGPGTNAGAIGSGMGGPGGMGGFGP